MTKNENSIVVAGRSVQVKRILIPTPDLQIDAPNPRIRYKLKLYNPTLSNQELVAILMQDPDVQRLLMNIRDNRGLHEPILVTRTKRIIEGNCRAAAYIKLFERDGKPDSPWAQIPAHQIVDELSDKEIAILQGYYHITGKNKWKKYEKAGHIHYMYKSLGMSIEKIQKELGLHGKTVENLLEAYNAMNQHYLPVYGQQEADPLKKFSYFEELCKRDELRTFREKPKNIEKFAEWVADSNMLPEGRDVRRLGDILKHPKARRIFEKNGWKAANKILGRYDPTLESNLFKLIQRTTQELKKLKARDASDIKDNQQKQKLLRELIRIARQVAEMCGLRRI